MILGIRRAEVRAESSAPELRTAALRLVGAMNIAILSSSTEYLEKGYALLERGEILMGIKFQVYFRPESHDPQHQGHSYQQKQR